MSKIHKRIMLTQGYTYIGDPEKPHNLCNQIRNYKATRFNLKVTCKHCLKKMKGKLK